MDIYEQLAALRAAQRQQTMQLDKCIEFMERIDRELDFGIETTWELGGSLEPTLDYELEAEKAGAQKLLAKLKKGAV